MHEYERELEQLGVELKDYYTGLIDFPCWMDGREVYLCWRLGEPDVAHWHEVTEGFAGRQTLLDADGKPLKIRSFRRDPKGNAAAEDRIV